MAYIIPIYSKLTENECSFVFHTDRPLTQEEKKRISSKALSALVGVVKMELGELAEHNCSFGFSQ